MGMCSGFVSIVGLVFFFEHQQITDVSLDGRTATDSAPNDFVDTPTCINIPYNVTIKAISAGRRHSGALTHCGRILLWGSNKERQLARRLPGQLFWDDLETESDEYEGKGPTKDPFTSIPEFLPTSKQVFFEGFACGDSFTIAFTNDRVSQTTHIYVFGSFVRRSVPEGIYQSIPWGKKGKVVQVVAPTMHAMLLTEKGYLYAAGQYRSRQLGTPRGAVNVPMHTSKCALFDPVILPDDVRVAQIACGGYHTVVLTTNKQIYVWGDNRYGQFGCPTATATLQTLHPSLTNMDMVCAGANHTLAVGADGKV
jgi:alpha-tubulin suppressor-like RCC1 family protein